MPRIDKLYDWLAAQDPPEPDRIFAAALVDAESPYFERICDLLLKRGHPISHGGLVAAFDRLPPPAQQFLTEDTDRLKHAVAEALKLPAPAARLGGLQLVEQHGLIQLAPLVADALLDRNDDVRAAAGRLLLQLAAAFLRAHGPVPPMPGKHVPKDVSFARRQLTQALEEAVRRFNHHWRLEPVRAALWFARDYGESLWAVMGTVSSRVREVVVERLSKWDDPRMAGFYLLGLQKTSWRTFVEPVLSTWCEREKFTALLAHSDLLDQADFRQRLTTLHEPLWFRDADRFIMELNLTQRRLAPRWLAQVNYPKEERCNLLSRWAHRSCPTLERACVYALARIDHPEAQRRLQELAASSTVTGTFARWWCAGKRGTPHTSHPSAQGASAKRTASARRSVLQPSHAEFKLYWELCQAAPAEHVPQLLRLLREHLALWSDEVVAQLRSSKPRDRLMAMHVLATEQLAQRHKLELRTLLTDDVPAIRERAKKLLQSVGRAHADGAAVVPPPNSPPGSTQPARPVPEVRADLLRLLVSTVEQAASAAVLAEKLTPLSSLLGEFQRASAADATRGEASE